MKISKILTYVVLAVGVLGVVLWFLMSSGIRSLMAENGVTEARELPLEVVEPAVNPIYFLTWAIFIVIVVATLISVFSTMAKNPGGLKNTLIGVVAFLIVVGIGYVLADGVETPMKDGEVLSATKSKLVGAGLYAVYFLTAIAVGMMFLSGIKKLIGK